MAPRLTAIHLTVLVNGKPASALLDTGVMLSVCSKDVATRCGLVESRSSSRLQQGVLGPPKLCTTAMATVSLGRATTTLSMSVIDNPDAAFNMLLGADWCEHFAVEISFRTRGHPRAFRRHPCHCRSAQFSQAQALSSKGPSAPCFMPAAPHQQHCCRVQGSYPFPLRQRCHCSGGAPT